MTRQRMLDVRPGDVCPACWWGCPTACCPACDALRGPTRLPSMARVVCTLGAPDDPDLETWETSWGEWGGDNPREAPEVEAALLRGESYRAGGGAQPEWTVRRA